MLEVKMAIRTKNGNYVGAGHRVRCIFWDGYVYNGTIHSILHGKFIRFEGGAQVPISDIRDIEILTKKIIYT